MKRAVSILALACVASMSHAATITQWNFNTLDGNGTTGTLAPSVGSGSIGAIGGASSFFGFAGGSSDPEIASEDSAWGVSNLPEQGTLSGTAGMQGLVSTLGFQGIVLSFDIKTQFSSSKYYQVQYRTSGGGPWLEAETFGVAVEDVWENQRSVDLSALDSGVNDNADFGFRIVAVFKPGTGEYAGMNDQSNSYGRFGTLNDMVTISGSPVPEPATILVLGAAGLALVRRRSGRG